MTEEEQKRIFAKNLNYYISLSGKQQKEVAQELGFRVTTFNTWCKGKIIPGMGKVQKLADYFKISQPLASHHLRLLKDAKIVEANRYGKQIIYRLKNDKIKSFIEHTLNSEVIK